MPPLTVYESIKSLKIDNSTAVNEFYYSEQFLKSLSGFCSVNSVKLPQKFKVLQIPKLFILNVHICFTYLCLIIPPGGLIEEE